MSVNPLIAQGLLNRVITHIVVPSFPQLSTLAPYMSKGQAQLTFEGPFVDQHPTATGTVNAPNPYVFGQLVINLLRTQALSGLWIAQAQLQSTIGSITAYPDSTVFPAITLLNASITDHDPGAYDGGDPAVKVTVRGTYPINASMWAAAAASGVIST